MEGTSYRIKRYRLLEADGVKVMNSKDRVILRWCGGISTVTSMACLSLQLQRGVHASLDKLPD